MNGHDAMDDMGDWALEHTRRIAIEAKAKYDAEESQRRKVLSESVEHYRRCRWCSGVECAAPKCHELSAEMAVYAHEDPPRTALGAMREWMRDLLADWRAR